MNQYLDQQLQPFVNYYQDNWSELLPMIDYAQLTLLHSSLGIMLPFELLNSYLLRMSFDWSPLEKEPTSATQELSWQQAKEIASQIDKALEKGREFIKRAQEKKEHNVNAHCRPID